MSNLKIRREVFIEQLQKRITQHETLQAKYDAEIAEWKKKTFKAVKAEALAVLKNATEDTVNVVTYGYRNESSVTINNLTIPPIEQPEYPTELYRYFDLNEARQAIKLLTLSEDEFVSASFSKRWANYL